MMCRFFIGKVLSGDFEASWTHWGNARQRLFVWETFSFGLAGLFGQRTIPTRWIFYDQL